ncbi:SDR family NAD(P)-dependent oxidoreductase [Glacieibacterium megasporae]|uniref:SDR family NAD(P)-dependent oxidoreductase n=1 Tax=Glacieibacterium megasporae TaxID=2835787 RepID=UPI001C1E04FF|nr:glucose 1-dehydrogenase [Polymorphobacter megasporae]UAJ12564.1 glucose 1-dehydrogenase [Polymorphobacter megasporae]
MANLDGRVAIVTGAASGIGFAIARDLARQGARVAICDVADPTAAVATLRGEGADVVGVRADIADEEAVAAAHAAVVAAFGRIDILVNNAGLFTTITRAPFDQLDVAEWRRVIDVNVTGTYLFSRAVWPSMRAAGGGRIVNITSGSVWSAPAMMLHYVTSKGALTAMTRSMAREMGPDNITVNAVAPGFTISDGVLEHRHDMLATAAGRARSARALQRDQAPGDIVGAVAFLCGDGSAFVTGQTIVVDGGAVMR